MLVKKMKISFKRHILIMLPISLFFIIYLILGYGRNSWDMCNPENALVYVPTVEKISSGYVVLADGRKLWSFGPKLRNSASLWFPVNIWLLSSGHGNATFAYETIEDYSGSAPGDKQRFVTRCLYTVSKDTTELWSPYPAVILRPSDLDKKWWVTDYIEYTDDVFRPISRNHEIDIGAYFETAPGSGLPLFRNKYLVFLSIRKFNSDDDALHEFENMVETLNLTENTLPEGKYDIDNYIEYCGLKGCTMIGSQSTYFIQAIVVSKDGFYKPGLGNDIIPFAYWRELTDTVMDKFKSVVK